MIITARLARLLASNQMQEKPKYRRSIRQLRKIERKIAKASEKGKKHIMYYNELYTGVHSALELSGYKIHDRSDWDSFIIEISWNDE